MEISVLVTIITQGLHSLPYLIKEYYELHAKYEHMGIQLQLEWYSGYNNFHKHDILLKCWTAPATIHKHGRKKYLLQITDIMHIYWIMTEKSQILIHGNFLGWVCHSLSANLFMELCSMNENGSREKKWAFRGRVKYSENMKIGSRKQCLVWEVCPLFHTLDFI